MLSIDFKGALDTRLERRCKSFSSSLFRSNSVSIQGISKDRADQIGNYRLLHNDRVGEDLLIKEQQNRCSQLVKDKVVLAIHDSSEANYFRHKNRLKPDSGLGPIDASKGGIGFKMHLSFALDAKSFFPYGISSMKIWDRSEKKKLPYHKSRRLSIEEKESYKWLEGCTKSNEVLEAAQTIIHVQDREGDMYEQILDFGTDEKVHYIIRSSYDRYIEQDEHLWQQVSSSPLLGTYKLNIDGESHSKRSKREATMEVRAYKTKVKCPDDKYKGLAAFSKEITIIETKEINPPEGITPLVWRLLTSLSINTITDGIQVIEWYTARWYIEELFRVLKKENFDIESSEIENGYALRKLAIFTIDTCVKIFQFYICREIEEGETLESISSFSPDEFECLKKINKTVEGKTVLQKNPHKEYSNKWTIWILSRLGGWKGYDKQRKPGMTTIIKGLVRFYNIYTGYVINIDVCTR